MNKKLPALLLTAVTLTSLTVLGAATRPRATSIQGVWRTVEVRLPGPVARTIHSPSSLGIITAKYYSRVEVHGQQPRPALPDTMSPTAEQLRATWGPFFAEAGTYELSRPNVLTMRPLIAKNPAVMNSGFFATYTYRVAGDTLWLTEQRNSRGPIAKPATVELVRVE